jgi:hypothetical protein
MNKRNEKFVAPEFVVPRFAVPTSVGLFFEPTEVGTTNIRGGRPAYDNT